MAGDASRENGRKGGRPKDPTSENYRKTLLKEVKERQNELARALIDKGLTGDVPALREIHDRVMGKPTQDIDLGGAVFNVKVTAYGGHDPEGDGDKAAS